MSNESPEELILYLVTVPDGHMRRSTHVHARDACHARELVAALLRRYDCPARRACFEACPDGFGVGTAYFPGKITVQTRDRGTDASQQRVD